MEALNLYLHDLYLTADNCLNERICWFNLIKWSVNIGTLGVPINLAPGLYNVNNNKLQRENWIMPMVQTVLQFDQLVIVLSRCPETQ